MQNRKKDNNLQKDIISKPLVSDQVKDYSNDPFIVRKVEASKKIIEKYGLPKDLTTVKK